MPIESTIGAAALTDPYASAKANLRDTVKWLATAFAALAAAVLAGTSVTDLSGLSGSHLAIALAGGAAGVISVLVSVGVLLRLLTSESVFLSDLKDDDAIKATLNKYADDILPLEIPSVDELLRQRAAAIADIRTKDRTSNDYAQAAKFFADVEVFTARLVNWVQLEGMRRRIRETEPVLFGLGIAALIGIGLFAVMTGSAKGSAAERAARGPLSQLTPGKSWSDVGKALSDACGDVAPIKVQLMGQPQPGWVEVRLLAPPACAGIYLSVPGHVVASPDALPGGGAQGKR